MHIPQPIPLDSLLAISYRNHQKNLAYFSHYYCSFVQKGRVKWGGGGALHIGTAPKYAPEGRI